MLMTAVIHPDAFDRAHFEQTPNYRDSAELLLRGLVINGLLLIDPERRLFDELKSRINKLHPKDFKRVETLLTALCTIRKRTVITAHNVCDCSQSGSLLDTARIVQKSCGSDTLIVDSLSYSNLVSQGLPSDKLTSLATYAVSTPFEEQRHRFDDQLPTIDRIRDGGDFYNHMIRVTRFSRILRLYDKQIGKSEHLDGFYRGIEKILALWVANSHFPRSSLSAEIYTCCSDSKWNPISPETVHTNILEHLVWKLFDKHRVPVALHLKKDSWPRISHDRYLQTDSVAISFSAGFDYVNEDGTLRRCTTNIQNGVAEHLQEYRRLAPFRLAPKFKLGMTVVPPDAVAALSATRERSSQFFARHAQGDWGECCDKDRLANEAALKNGGCLFSVYRTNNGIRLSVVTDAERSSTTLRLSETL